MVDKLMDVAADAAILEAANKAFAEGKQQHEFMHQLLEDPEFKDRVLARALEIHNEISFTGTGVQQQGPVMGFASQPTAFWKVLDNPTWCWIFAGISLIGGPWGIPIAIYFAIRAIGLKDKYERNKT